MDKIIFERTDEWDSESEPIRIEFDIKSGISIYDFKVICKRLASSIGYSELSIEDAFGDETITEKEMRDQARMVELLKLDVLKNYILKLKNK